MRAISFLLTAMFLVPLLAGASGCEMTSTQTDADTDPFGLGVTPRHYVVDDSDICAHTGLCFISIWVYEESNGIAGLQRQDEVVDDTCGGTAGPGDTVAL